MMQQHPIQHLWAKTGENEQFHLLIYHLIDVAEVALALWQSSLSESMRGLWSGMMGLPPSQAGQTLAFLAALHDLGKASPEFQSKFKPVTGRLYSLGLPLTPRQDIPHGVISTYALGNKHSGLLHAHHLTSRRLALPIARAVGGHHGAWASPKQLHDAGNASYQAEWCVVRDELFQALASLYAPSQIGEEITGDTSTFNTFLVLLSGFTTVADWIGSMVEYFPLRQYWMEPALYRQLASQQAGMALRETGWGRWQSEGETWAFERMFPALPSGPNPVQQAVINHINNLDSPCLVILEAPTGIGKTEAAYFLADTLIQRERLQGMYIAMPTQATSNQMYRRTEQFLLHRYPERQIRPRLLHSQAHWQIDSRVRPTGIYDTDGEAGSIRGTETSWFLPKKRGLLEPFAVGTVDQALLSVLWTRHFFVRLFGLGRKVVVFDEVHAYDTYMNELFHCLLAWLRRIGSSVVVLSATLPNRTRNELVRAFGGHLPGRADQSNCRVTIVGAGEAITEMSLDDSVQGRVVQINWLSLDNMLSQLEEALSGGGCAAVVCNTVRRTQEVYRELKQAQADGFLADCDLLLFHARYPAAWRHSIEQQTCDWFGKQHGRRPYRAILVATQVVEQSLDLDFDLILTDLPPIDLLIQRVGRLHRHPLPKRPVALAVPQVLIFEPEGHDEKGLPKFGSSEYVYDRFLLVNTWLALQGRTTLRLPEQSRELIEIVYGGGWQASPLQEELAKLEKASLEEHNQAQRQALLKVIPLPEDEDLLITSNLRLDEDDDPTVHNAFRAMTRLGESEIQILCLHRCGDIYSLEPDSSVPVDFQSKPRVSDLLRYVVGVSHRGVRYSLAQEQYNLPPAWAEESVLRYHRMVVFENGFCQLTGTRFALRLTPEFGLEVLNKEEA